MSTPDIIIPDLPSPAPEVPVPAQFALHGGCVPAAAVDGHGLVVAGIVVIGLVVVGEDYEAGEGCEGGEEDVFGYCESYFVGFGDGGAEAFAEGHYEGGDYYCY